MYRHWNAIANILCIAKINTKLRKKYICVHNKYMLSKIDYQIAEINVQHYEWLWPETIYKLFSHDRIKDIISIIKTFNYSPCMSSRINVPVLYFPSDQEDLNYRWRFWLQSKVSFHLCAVVWNNPHGSNYQGNDLLNLK